MLLPRDMPLLNTSTCVPPEILGHEFRARLSPIKSPLPSSICFSKARIESILTSRPILVSKLSGVAKCFETRRLTLTVILVLDFWGLVVRHRRYVEASDVDRGRQGLPGCP